MEELIPGYKMDINTLNNVWFDSVTYLKYYTKALEIDFDIYAAIGLALICKCQGKFEEAIDRFKNLIRNDPRNSRLYVDLAECYSLMNKKDEAIKLLEDYLSNDGKNIQIRNLLERLRR